MNSLQSQLHLEHFCPECIKIKLLGYNLEVEVTILDFVHILHLFLNHPDLTISLDNLDVNPADPFGKYVSPNGGLGPVNLGMWYMRRHITLV
jgi:hypothetical protein